MRSKAVFGLACSLSLTQCSPLLPTITPFHRTNDWSDPEFNRQSNSGPTDEASGLVSAFRTCENNITAMSNQYKRSYKVTQTFNALAGITGGVGSAGSLAGVLNIAGDNQTANKAISITGASISLVGSVVFSIIAGSSKPSTYQAQLERMLGAYRIARKRYSLTLACQKAFAETEKESSDTTVSKDCDLLSAPLDVPVPSVGPKSGNLTVESRQDLARQKYTPALQMVRIISYIDEWCQPTIFELPTPTFMK